MTYFRTCIKQLDINILTPKSDSHVTSPFKIHTLISNQVMRILSLSGYIVPICLNGHSKRTTHQVTDYSIQVPL